jgi:RHS repeat-associated protein
VQSGDVFADYGGTDGGAIHQIFAYNARGEVTAAATYLGATATDQTTPLSARKHEWDYDGIGNRKWSNTSGNTALKDNYTVNALNQYTGRENNTLAIGGVADTDALVAARSTALAGRAGKHWGDNITVENWLAPFFGNIKVYAVKPGSGGAAYARQTMERTAFLPPAAQTFTYDADGNLTNDGVWTYAWDAENRLIAMETTAGAVMGGMTAQKLEFKYDYMNRRAEKLVRGGWNGTSYTSVTSQRRYLWDGWSLLAEFSVSGSTLTKLRTYAWGLDIARSMKDAGGVGALLQIRDHASGKDYFPSYDGNGNIAALFDADSSTGTVAAAYEYSPYGEFLRCEGTYAKENPFRFSTKFTDDETGLVYYGRRYYDPANGRFMGRDPKKEKGGLNLYGFCGNNGINRWDVLGMFANGQVYHPGTGGSEGWMIYLANGPNGPGGYNINDILSGAAFSTGPDDPDYGSSDDSTENWEDYWRQNQEREAYLAARAAVSNGSLGSLPANNTFPFRQSTNASCAVNVVRNMEWIFTMGYGANGAGVRTETSIANIMTDRMGQPLSATFLQDGSGLDRPFVATFNAALNPIGLQMSQGSQYTGIGQFTALMSAAADNGSMFVTRTHLETNSGALSGAIAPNHVVTFVPYWHNSGGSNTLLIQMIDSGNAGAEPGSAAVTILTPTQAMGIAAFTNSSIGVQGSSVYLVSPVQPPASPTPRTAPPIP